MVLDYKYNQSRLSGSAVTWICAVLWLVTQSCLTLCDPMDCSPPRSSVRGFIPARTLEWVAMPFSGRSSLQADGFFTD